MSKIKNIGEEIVVEVAVSAIMAALVPVGTELAKKAKTNIENNKVKKEAKLKAAREQEKRRMDYVYERYHEQKIEKIKKEKAKALKKEAKAKRKKT